MSLPSLHPARLKSPRCHDLIPQGPDHSERLLLQLPSAGPHWHLAECPSLVHCRVPCSRDARLPAWERLRISNQVGNRKGTCLKALLGIQLTLKGLIVAFNIRLRRHQLPTSKTTLSRASAYGSSLLTWLYRATLLFTLFTPTGDNARPYPTRRDLKIIFPFSFSSWVTCLKSL